MQSLHHIYCWPVPLGALGHSEPQSPCPQGLWGNSGLPVWVREALCLVWRPFLHPRPRSHLPPGCGGGAFFGGAFHCRPSSSALHDKCSVSQTRPISDSLSLARGVFLFFCFASDAGSVEHQRPARLYWRCRLAVGAIFPSKLPRGQVCFPSLLRLNTLWIPKHTRHRGRCSSGFQTLRRRPGCFGENGPLKQPRQAAGSDGSPAGKCPEQKRVCSSVSSLHSAVVP